MAPNRRTPARTASLPPVPLSLAAFALLTWWSRDVFTVDMGVFLLPWMAHITATGPVAAFATPFSNYTPPYLYLLAAASPMVGVMTPAVVVKLLSVLGNLVLALAVRHLLVRLAVPAPNRGAALSLLVPSVLANAAVLHQCDALWAAAMVMALAATVERRHLAMFAWCGVGIAFKAQAALIGPFFLALALARGIPFRLWLAAPFATVSAMLPAIAAGWPVGDLVTIYLRQTQVSEALSLNAPNIWALVQGIAGPHSTFLGGLAFAVALGATGWYVAFFSVRLRRAMPAELVAAAALATMLTAGLLPRMHERYFFLADVLVAVLALQQPARRWILTCAQCGSCLAILAYLLGKPEVSSAMVMTGAVAMIGASWGVARPLLSRAANDDAPRPRARPFGWTIGDPLAPAPRGS